LPPDTFHIYNFFVLLKVHYTENIAVAHVACYKIYLQI